MEDIKQSNNQPVLSSFEDIALEELRQHYIDPRIKFVYPYHFYEYNGAQYSTLGGLFGNTGHKKSGKSQTTTIHIVAALSGPMGFGGIHVPERTIQHIGHPPIVYYADTEMEPEYTAMLQERVYRLLGHLSKDQIRERFFVSNLRNVRKDDSTGESANKKRLRLLKLGIDVYRPDIVFIDGLRDVIKNFNDSDESTDLIEDLMALAQDKHICIWTSLHLNPRPGYDDDSKMRGHLGTELGNKATGTFTTYKNKKGSDITFTIKHTDARGKDVDDIVFRVIDDEEHIGIPEIIETPPDRKGKSKITSASETILDDSAINAIRDILSPCRSIIWSQLRKELAEYLGITEKIANSFLNEARKYKLIKSDNVGNNHTWSFNPDFGDDNELPI